MILASVLGLEVLGRQAGITITLPNAVGKETFQGGLFHCTAIVTADSVSFTTTSEHYRQSFGEVVTWCCQVIRWTGSLEVGGIVYGPGVLNVCL